MNSKPFKILSSTIVYKSTDEDMIDTRLRIKTKCRDTDVIIQFLENRYQYFCGCNDTCHHWQRYVFNFTLHRVKRDEWVFLFRQFRNM